jgi:glycosyltransferase involved in cell wall biosynthesis
MKILFLAHHKWPHVGGVEKHVHELSKRLKVMGERVIIISEEDIEYPHAKFFGLLYIWFWLFRNRKLIENADVIHCHDVFIWYLPFRFLYLKKPVYITFHGYEKYPIPKKSLILHKIAERLTKGNIYIGDYIKKWYRMKKGIVSYGAVDLMKFHPSEKRKYDYEGVFVGRLGDQCVVLRYAEAIRILRRKGIKFDLLIIGDGRNRSKIEKDFDVLGWKNNPEKYFSKARFGFASRYLSIIEFMAAKKLVFATYPDPLHEDYLKMSPFAKWIIIEKDPRKLSLKIEDALRNLKKNSKNVEVAYEWVKEQTWEKMANEYISLYHNIK